MEKKVSSTINISTATFIKLILFIVIIFFLYLIKDVLALVFVALILASALDPWVDWLQKVKIPRGIGILLIYIIIFSIGFTILYLIVPPIVMQIGQIANHFPEFYNKIVNGLQSLQSQASDNTQTEIQKSLISLSSGIPFALSNIFSFFTGFFGGLVSVILILVIAFYLTIQEDNLKKFIRAISPSKVQPYINQVIYRIQRKLGAWLRGQIVLSFIIFVLSYIGLTILGVPYALLLALIAGVMEVIPLLGPTIAMIPAVFFGFIKSPLTGFLVLAVYLIIQQLENHVITPKIYSKSVDMNPLVVIIVILIGAKIGGVPGCLIAVPVAAAISVFISDFLNTKNSNELKLEEDENLTE
jgi:predicted PurR-regulated permease PerM